MLNKRRYTSDSAVFNMFTVILANTFHFFKTMTLLVEAVFVNESSDIFPFGDYRHLQLFQFSSC